MGLSDFTAQADEAPFALFVLDVGKADCLLVECGDFTLLVDGGTADRGEEITAFLHRRGIQRIDLMVNTHPDKDHIGGLAEVLFEYPVSAYWTPRLPDKLIPDSEEYKQVQAALKSLDIAVEYPRAGDRLSLGSLAVDVLAPTTAGKSANDSSLVLRLTFGETRFLLMGDAEKDEEKSLLDSGADLRAQFLKVGHHGSKTSTTQAFLNAVQPSFAAISVADDSNGLPKKSVLERLARMGAAIYQTDVFGTLLFTSDGTNISVATER